MSEKPIIFSAEMVRVILEGRKTQTRRVIKPQPPSDFRGCTCTHGTNHFYPPTPQPRTTITLKCPYGQVGDRLWVRETWALRGDGKQIMHKEGYETIIKALELPDFGIKWRSPRFMPRWASRLTLEITEVRVERVQEITSNDCQDEGLPHPPPQGDTTHYIKAYINSFRQLWDSLNAKRGYGWVTNPFCWVIEFKRIS